MILYTNKEVISSTHTMSNLVLYVTDRGGNILTFLGVISIRLMRSVVSQS